MARRKRMHGKRRRQSSHAPFKIHEPGHVEENPQELSDEQVTSLADYLGGLEGGVKKPDPTLQNLQESNNPGVTMKVIHPGQELNALGEISEPGYPIEMLGGVISDEDMSAATSAYSPAQHEAYHGRTDKERAKADLYHRQRSGEIEGYEGDSFGENLLEFVDITGLSSWDDAARAWKHGTAWDKFIETLGVIPMVGKFKAPIKAAAAGINLIKRTDPKSISQIAKGVTKGDVLKGLSFYDTAEDVYEDNIKPNWRDPQALDSKWSGWSSGLLDEGTKTKTRYSLYPPKTGGTSEVHEALGIHGPFKQLTGFSEATVNDRSYMSPDYTGVRTDTQALEYMRSLGDKYGYHPEHHKEKPAETKDDSYKDLPLLGHDESASEVKQQTVSKKQKTQDVLEPPPDLKLDVTEKQDKTRVAGTDYDQVGAQEKTRITNDIISSNISKSREENPEQWAKYDADKAQREAQKYRNTWENRLNSLQVGLSVGGVGFPPLDILNAVISGGRTLHAGLTGDWKSAGEHLIATGGNLAAVIPGPGDALGVGINSARASAHALKTQGIGKTFMQGTRKTMMELGGSAGTRKAIGQGVYWFGDDYIPGTDFSLGSGTVPTMWDMLNKDDKSKKETQYIDLGKAEF